LQTRARLSLHHKTRRERTHDDGHERVRSRARGAHRREQTADGGDGHRVPRGDDRANADADQEEDDVAGAFFRAKFTIRDFHNEIRLDDGIRARRETMKRERFDADGFVSSRGRRVD
jgi:hypothetical protein